jgi:hypothetical protein
MKRIVNALGKINWAGRACAVFVLCAATVVALPAQTFTKLFNFDVTNGYEPMAGQAGYTVESFKPEGGSRTYRLSK